MLPKKGKGFPKRDGKGGGGLSYAEAIAIALRQELDGTHQAVKTVMRWTGAGERTAKNWLAGARGPTGEHLVSTCPPLECGTRGLPTISRARILVGHTQPS